MKILLTENQLKYIVEVSTSEINAECQNVNLNPTEAQKEAGNYKMGHFYIKGMPISIENPVGSIRKYKKEDGSEGTIKMKNHYGYFTNTSGNGKDGDAVDVFIGPNPENFERVYVIDQNTKNGDFDESKVMIGFDSKDEAKKAYMSNYSPGWTGFRTITGVSLRLFKKWLYRGNKQRKPFSEYVEIQKKKLEECKNPLNEKAYVNKIKGNRAMIHYTSSDYGEDNLKSSDSIKTDKMDVLNADTYKIPLKGGLISYNITSIQGTSVMKYFKHHFDNQQVKMKIGKKDFNLDMEETEFIKFREQFKKKVQAVIADRLNDFKSNFLKTKFKTISIYPVKSSSNFNIAMANELKQIGLYGMKVQVVNDNILVKDAKMLQMDRGFVQNNYGFYLSPRSKNSSSVYDYLGTNIEKKRKAYEAQQNVTEINDCFNKIKSLYYQRNKKNALEQLAKEYIRYINLIVETINKSEYLNKITNKKSSQRLYKLIRPVHHDDDNNPTEAIYKSTDKILNLIRPYLHQSSINKIQPLCQWEVVPFEIKNISNGERMGLQNLYRFATDENGNILPEVIEELEKIKGTLLVVFDDNISGGATLSDVCYQFKNQGFEYIVPITFGKMGEKWQLGTVPLYQPLGGFNFTNDMKKSPKYYDGINENIGEKQKLTMLWVDDQRGPEKHFKNASKQIEPENPEGTKDMNYIAFRELMSNYDISFYWVKTFTEFVNYINENGVPEFVSFDRDLTIAPGYDGKSGSDCARWLSEYCKKNGFNIPKYFIHSANINAYDEITSALSTETLFTPSNPKFKFKRRELQN